MNEEKIQNKYIWVIFAEPSCWECDDKFVMACYDEKTAERKKKELRRDSDWFEYRIEKIEVVR